MPVIASITGGRFNIDVARPLMLELPNYYSGLLIIQINLALHILELRVRTGFLLDNQCRIVIHIFSEIGHRLLTAVITLLAI